MIKFLRSLTLLILLVSFAEPRAPSGVKAIKSELPLKFDPAPFKEKTALLRDELEKGLYISADYALPYRVFKPKGLKEKQKVPLVVFLHGLGEGGKDNNSQLKHPQVLSFCLPDSQAKNPCFLVAPQLNQNGEFWIGEKTIQRQNPRDLHPSEKTAKGKNRPAPTAAQEALMEMIAELIKDNPGIDPDRVVVTGLSSGGCGCYALLYHFPNHFSAMAPICAGSKEIAERYLVSRQELGVWGFFNRDESQRTKDGMDLCLLQLEKHGADTRRTTFDSPDIGGHAAWEWAYAEPKLIPWLFAQKRKKAAGTKPRW